MSGDDDVEAGDVSDASSGAELKRIVVPQVHALLLPGLDARIRPGAALIKVDVAGAQLAADPLWFADGQAYGCVAVAATRDDYSPVSTAHTDGWSFLAPAIPEVILAGSYGGG